MPHPPEQSDSREDVDLILRAASPVYLDTSIVTPLYTRISTELQPYLAKSPHMRDTIATRKLLEVFRDHRTVCDFFQTQDFYIRFKTEARALGLSGDFDAPGQCFSFAVERQTLPAYTTEALRRNLIQEGARLEAPAFIKKFGQKEVLDSIRKDMETARNGLLAERGLQESFFTLLEQYFLAIFLLAKCRYPNFSQEIMDRIQSDNLLEALAKIEEFYRDKIGNEIINLEPNEKIKLALLAVLDQELDRIRSQFKHFHLTEVQKPEKDEQVPYELTLDSRDPDAIVRGAISSDCTDLRVDYAFHETVPQHLLDPGFLNFKLFEDGKWVGNVYALVMAVDGEPILVIDAIQTSEEHQFRTPTISIAEKVIEQIKLYAARAGFKRTYLSRFISNRGLTHYVLSSKYSTQDIKVRKVGGFQHLKSLGLWFENLSRNEYLETLMPGKPNEEEQVLPMRLL